MHKQWVKTKRNALSVQQHEQHACIHVDIDLSRDIGDVQNDPLCKIANAMQNYSTFHLIFLLTLLTFIL